MFGIIDSDIVAARTLLDLKRILGNRVRALQKKKLIGNIKKKSKVI